MNWIDEVKGKRSYISHRLEQISKAQDLVVKELRKNEVKAIVYNTYNPDRKTFELKVNDFYIEFTHPELVSKEEEVRNEQNYKLEDELLVLCEAIKKIIIEKHTL